MHPGRVVGVHLAVPAAAEVGRLVHVQPQAVKGHLVVEVLQLLLDPGLGVGSCQVVGVDGLTRPYLHSSGHQGVCGSHILGIGSHILPSSASLGHTFRGWLGGQV